jgi:hypothetical protein
LTDRGQALAGWLRPKSGAENAVLDTHYLGRDVQLAEAAVLKLEKRTKL